MSSSSTAAAQAADDGEARRGGSSGRSIDGIDGERYATTAVSLLLRSLVAGFPGEPDRCCFPPFFPSVRRPPRREGRGGGETGAPPSRASRAACSLPPSPSSRAARPLESRVRRRLASRTRQNCPRLRAAQRRRRFLAVPALSDCALACIPGARAATSEAPPPPTAPNTNQTNQTKRTTRPICRELRCAR